LTSASLFFDNTFSIPTFLEFLLKTITKLELHTFEDDDLFSIALLISETLPALTSLNFLNVETIFTKEELAKFPVHLMKLSGLYHDGYCYDTITYKREDGVLTD